MRSVQTLNDDSRLAVVVVILTLLAGLSSTAAQSYGGYGDSGKSSPPPVYGQNDAVESIPLSTAVGTARLVGPLSSCQVTFTSLTQPQVASASSASLWDGSFTFQQNATGMVALKPSATCVDTFTQLPITFPLKSLAGSLGRIAITPASLLTSAYFTNTPLDPDLYDNVLISTEHAIAYSKSGLSASLPWINGAIDPLYILRNSTQPTPIRAQAAHAYITDLQLLGLFSIGSSYLQPLVNISSEAVVEAIARSLESTVGRSNLTDDVNVRAIIRAAPSFLTSSPSFSWNGQDTPLSFISAIIAATNQATAEMDGGPDLDDPVSWAIGAAKVAALQQQVLAPAVATAVVSGNLSSLMALDLAQIWSTVVVNHTAILNFFGVPAPAVVEGRMQGAVGAMVNCQATYFNMWQPESGLLFNVSSTGSFSIANAVPGLIQLSPSTSVFSCQDSITNARLTTPLQFPLHLLPSLTLTPLTALALPLFALQQNLQMYPNLTSLTPAMAPPAPSLPLNFTPDTVVQAYAILGFNQSSLGVDFASFSGPRLVNGQPLRAAVMASSSQLLALLSVGTSFISRLRNAPPAHLVSRHILRAVVNNAIANGNSPGKPGTANLAAQAHISRTLVDALKGAFAEAAFLKRMADTSIAINTTASSNSTNSTASSAARKLLHTLEADQTLEADVRSATSRHLLQVPDYGVFTFDASELDSITLVLGKLTESISATNTMLQATQQAALDSTNSSTATFDMYTSVMSIASISSVQQSDMAAVVTQLAGAIYDPSANLSSLLNSFSSNFSGAALDSRIQAAAATVNKAEITAVSTPPPTDVTQAPAPVDKAGRDTVPSPSPSPALKMPSSKKSNSVAVGMGVGVGVSAAFLVASAAGYMWMKRRNAQLVGTTEAAQPLQV